MIHLTPYLRELLIVIANHGEDGMPWDCLNCELAQILEECGIIEDCGTTYVITPKGTRLIET